MIRVRRRNYFNVPDKIQNANAALQAIAVSGNKNLIRDTIYKGTETVNGIKYHRVQEVLRKIYYNKCAYCEKTENKPEIEHYRPKKEVSEDANHPGYYWLV